MCTMFTKSHWSPVNVEIFYICLTFDRILLVILTGFSWALINKSALFMFNLFDFLQKCLVLIRKMLVNMSSFVKRFVNTDVLLATVAMM